MAKRTNIALSDPPHDGLREFWRSSPANKKKVEKWVDDNTVLGSVPVFLRSGSADLFEKIAKDLKMPGY